MRIIIVNNVFPPGYVGGYELGALEIARGLKAKGHEILVLTSNYFQDDDGQLTDLTVERNLDCNFVAHHVIETHIVEWRGFYVDPPNVRKLASAVRRFRADLVMLFNTMGLGPLGLQSFLRGSGIPAVVYLMDNVYCMVKRESVQYKNYCNLFGRPDFGEGVKVIAMSKNVVREVDHGLGVELQDVAFVPGWIHVDRDAPAPVCANHGPKARFVVCSRIAGHKGIQVVIDAAATLVKEGVTGFSIDMYGAGEVGPFIQSIQANGVGEYIHYKGNLPKEKMLGLFADYDALLFPTWPREPFGFTVTEAAAVGCLPVMTAGIGASEWFLDGVDCIKIAQNPDSLLAAMKHIMSMPAAEMMQLRLNAIRTARSFLSFDRWINVIENTCQEMIVDQPSPDRTRAVQASILYLSQLWRESF